MSISKVSCLYGWGFCFIALIFSGTGFYQYQKLREVRNHNAQLEHAHRAYQNFISDHGSRIWSETAYLKQYPDVAQAIQDKSYAGNGFQHYLHHGLFEGRRAAYHPAHKKIRQETRQYFNAYLDTILSEASTDLEKIVLLMDWFSGIGIQCRVNTEKLIARKLQKPVRELPLHEVIYLLKTKQYAMLCGNYGVFFSRILNRAGYRSYDYDTSYKGITHVVNLVYYPHPEKEKPVLTVWDSFYNYHIADHTGQPVGVSEIFRQLRGFYTTGTRPTLQTVIGKTKPSKALFSNTLDTGDIESAHALRESNNIIDISEGKGVAEECTVVEFRPSSQQYLESKLPWFVNPELGDLFVSQILMFPNRSKNRQIIAPYLQPYPELPSLVARYLDQNGFKEIE